MLSFYQKALMNIICYAAGV